MSLLKVQQLSKAFGGNQAVLDLGFEVEPGELVALIGPNGAGKSTVFNLLNGQLKPDRGSALLDGQSLTGQRPEAIWGMGVGRTFQIPETFASLTVLENVQMALLSHHRQHWNFWRSAAATYKDEAMALLQQLDLADLAPSACGALSYGDVKRVELAVALAHAPRLVLMDEPTAGMALTERHALMTLVQQQVRRTGLAVLFTEHSMDVVFGFADRVLVMARGQRIAEGSPTSIANNPEVRQVYLGVYPTPDGTPA